MLYRKIIAVYSDIHTKHINILCGKNVDFYLNLNYISRPSPYRAVNTLRFHSKNQSVNVVQGNNGRLFSHHTKHINTVWAENGFLSNPELYLKTQSVPRSKHTLLGSRNQSVNAVQGNSGCLFSDPQKTHKESCVGRSQNFI